MSDVNESRTESPKASSCAAEKVAISGSQGGLRDASVATKNKFGSR